MPKVGFRYNSRTGSNELTQWEVNTLKIRGIFLLGNCYRFMGSMYIMEHRALDLWSSWKKLGGNFGVNADSPVVSHITPPYLPGGKWSICWEYIGQKLAYECCGVKVYKKLHTTLYDWAPDHINKMWFEADAKDMWNVFPYGWELLLEIGGVGVIKYRAHATDDTHKYIDKSIVGQNINKNDPSQGIWYQKITPPAKIYGDGEIVEVDKWFTGNGAINRRYHVPGTIPKPDWEKGGFLSIKMQLSVARFYGDDTTIPLPDMITIHHECDVNVRIIPDDGTQVLQNTPVHISVIGDNGKTINKFTVRDDNGTIDVMDLLTKTDDQGQHYGAVLLDNSFINYTFNASTSDIYICANADILEVGLDTPEGTTKTKYFTCNDCAQQLYSIERENLPAGATATITKSGTQGILYVTMPLGAPHDSGFFIDIKVSGLNSSETIRVNLTVLDPPYSGTIWQAKGLVPNATCIVQDDSTGRYYVGTSDQTIYWSDDLIHWNLMTISGSFADSSAFASATITDDYIVFNTQLDIVKASKVTNTFSVVSALTSWAYYILYFKIQNIPGTNKIYVGGGNSKSVQHLFDVDSDTIITKNVYQENPVSNGWATDSICVDTNNAIFGEGATSYSKIDITSDQITTNPTTEKLSISSSGNAGVGFAIDEANAGTYYALCWSATADIKELYKTTDSGANWAKVSDVNNCALEFYRTIAWGGQNALSANGLNNKMLYSLDGGISWAESSSDVDGYCKEMIRNKSGYLVALTNGSTNNIYLSEA